MATKVASSSAIVTEILDRSALSPSEFAQYLGASLVSVSRWQRGDTHPDRATQARLEDVRSHLREHSSLPPRQPQSIFASRGARRTADLPLFRPRTPITLATKPKPKVITRLRQGELWNDGGAKEFAAVMLAHDTPATTRTEPAAEGISAGKNTYTYDAHTYHTKVPPQGIAQVIQQYLPEGGLVLDPFAGSGMTGVAARACGADVVLNELSPSASFIADRFTRTFAPELFASGIRALCDSLESLRRQLYTTQCRECGGSTEILYTVWSYGVRCYGCDHEFVLWDRCRRYGKTVREHKILSEFSCEKCGTMLKKSRLPRTSAKPVLLGYRCCSKQQIEHPLSAEDLSCLQEIETLKPDPRFVPSTDLPDGVNLCQPKRHGLTSVDRFYTHRNLLAMSGLWRAIHCIEDDQLAGFLAFAFTSLYQRVTKLSEFRFWGGSGNTAHFNVPYIFNEANVFVTFERKARSIQDHLETTAARYGGQAVVRTGSATDLRFLPDKSVDFIFTDPPFGANINYSEMNILWESWLGEFTDTTDEAIVNKFQNKDVQRYQSLMTRSLEECHRVLRDDHWMVLVFMNSSHQVWDALSAAVSDAGFALERVDIFDKQHGTFKQFVSDNTAGCDLLLHCRKSNGTVTHQVSTGGSETESVHDFFTNRQGRIPTSPFLHVDREDEIDFRMLYSEFLATGLLNKAHLVDFATFRRMAAIYMSNRDGKA
jgi:DNA modification methylase